MAAASGGGVLADVQRQLAAGWSDEEILAALTAKGLSPASAARFLQRARPAPASPPDASTSVEEAPLPEEAPTLRSQPPPPLPSADAVAPPPPTALSAAPASLPEPTTTWPAAASDRVSQAYVLGGALVLVAGLAIVGVVSTTGAPRRATAVPATPERTPAPARPDHAPTARAQEIAQHVARLQGAGGDPCRAAAALADLGARDQVPELIRFVDDAADSQHQVCGAHALVRLGEGLAMLPSFVDWSEGDDEQLIDGAIVGFGLIGPSAAHEAIPILRAALVAGPSPADRNRIVATLARLGPAAAPVLQLAVDDEDAQVRTAAQAALERLR